MATPADHTPSAATVDPAGLPAGWADGSFVIERYAYQTTDRRSAVQWLVYHVKDGQFWMLRSCDTRREAAEFIGSRRG